MKLTRSSWSIVADNVVYRIETCCSRELCSISNQTNRYPSKRFVWYLLMLVAFEELLFSWPAKSIIVCDGGEHAFSLSPQELFGSVVRRYENDTLAAGLIWPFNHDGSFRRLWMTWRRDRLFCQSISTAISMFREQMQLSGRSSKYLLSRLFTLYISSMHLARVSWPSILVCPILLEAFSNGPVLPSATPSSPTLLIPGRKLYDHDLDHLPWPRSVSFAGLRYRVDRERQYIGWMGCILASTEIWDWIYGISGSVVIVSWLSSMR